MKGRPGGDGETVASWRCLPGPSLNEGPSRRGRRAVQHSPCRAYGGVASMKGRPGRDGELGDPLPVTLDQAASMKGRSGRDGEVFHVEL
ncbi:hypothetical protein GCM10009533_72030 [Saccharopolyspora spinosporotrichia]